MTGTRAAAAHGGLGPASSAARAAAAVLLAVVAWSSPPGPAAAQEPTVVEAGEVATVPVSFPLPGGAASAPTYRVEPADVVRLFGPGRGTAAVEGETAVAAVTFQTAAGLEAGVHRVARVIAEWPDGGPDTATVRIRVPARHRLEAGFVVSSATVGAGGQTEIGYRVVNRGNAPDTARLELVEDDAGGGWRFVPRRSRITLDPGHADTVPVRVHAPSGAGVGAVRRVRLLASGRGSEAAGVLTLHVVERSGWVSGVEHVPGEVFLGSSTARAPGGDPGVVAGVRAGGTVGGDTRVSLEGHYRPDGLATPRPLRREAAGPEVRLRLERPDWEASAGDVFARANPLAGSFLAGRGADVRWDGRGFFGEVFASAPSSGLGDGGGHSVMAAGGVELGDGRVGLVASDHETSGALAASSGRTRSVGGRVELGSRADRFARLELGVLRLEPDSGGSVTGPAAEGELWLSDDAGYLSVRARAVPGQLAGGPTLGDELFVGGRRTVVGPLDAVGRASLSSGEAVAGGGGSDAARVEGGVDLAAADVRLEGLVRHEETDVLFPEEGDRTRRSAVLSVDAPVGPLEVDTRVELGRERSPAGASGFRRLRATLRWQARQGWAWLTAGEEASSFVGARRWLEAEGAWETGRVRLSGGASAESAQLGELEVDAWTRAAVRVTDGLSLVGGVERDAPGLAGEPWSVSLGVRKGVDLPLPMPESAVSHGVVFEDRDGDGERDPGERGLEGVRLRKGFVAVVTDRRGRFEIVQEAVRGRPLQVDAASLPGDAVVTPGATIASEGEAAVPVLRTSRLVLGVFVDEDGDGEREAGEPPASEAVVELTGGDGRRRLAEADEDGRVTFGAVRPGPWRVSVTVPETLRRLEAVERFEVDLSPGESLAREVPVRPERKPVR